MDDYYTSFSVNQQNDYYQVLQSLSDASSDIYDKIGKYNIGERLAAISEKDRRYVHGLFSHTNKS